MTTFATPPEEIRCTVCGEVIEPYWTDGIWLHMPAGVRRC